MICESTICDFDKINSFYHVSYFKGKKNKYHIKKYIIYSNTILDTIDYYLNDKQFRRFFKINKKCVYKCFNEIDLNNISNPCINEINFNMKSIYDYV